MRERSKSSWFGWAVLLLAVATVSGCDRPPGSDVLEALEPGTPKSEVLAALPHGGVMPRDPTDDPQLMQGYWHERYFVQGGTVEVLWLHDVEEGYPTDEFRVHLNPVIFRDEVLDGWGWEHFDMRRADWMLVERGAEGAGVGNPGVLVPPGTPQEPGAAPDDPDSQGTGEGGANEDSFSI